MRSPRPQYGLSIAGTIPIAADKPKNSSPLPRLAGAGPGGLDPTRPTSHGHSRTHLATLDLPPDMLGSCLRATVLGAAVLQAPGQGQPEERLLEARGSSAALRRAPRRGPGPAPLLSPPVPGSSAPHLDRVHPRRWRQNGSGGGVDGSAGAPAPQQQRGSVARPARAPRPASHPPTPDPAAAGPPPSVRPPASSGPSLSLSQRGPAPAPPSSPGPAQPPGGADQEPSSFHPFSAELAPPKPPTP